MIDGVSKVGLCSAIYSCSNGEVEKHICGFKCMTILPLHLDINSEILYVNPRTAGGVFFSNIFATRANFKMRSKPVPSGSNSGCLDVYRMMVALSSTWSDMENHGQLPRKDRRFSAGRRNFGFQQHTDIIPTATPTFSTTADLNEDVDVTRRWRLSIQDGGHQTEQEITFER